MNLPIHSVGEPKDALRRVDALLKAGYVHVVDANLKRYFDSIPHAALMECLKTKIADGRVLSLIESFLQARIMDGTETWRRHLVLRRGLF